MRVLILGILAVVLSGCATVTDRLKVEAVVVRVAVERRLILAPGADVLEPSPVAVAYLEVRVPKCSTMLQVFSPAIPDSPLFRIGEEVVFTIPRAFLPPEGQRGANAIVPNLWISDVIGPRLKKPNKTPEPTSLRVTPPACAGAAPAVVVAHL